MKVRLEPQARADLVSIRRWIARDNPMRARSFVRELRGRMAALSDYSRRGVIVAKTPLGSVHKLVHGNYLIFYRVLTDRVDIIGVRHGRQSKAAWPT